MALGNNIKKKESNNLVEEEIGNEKVVDSTGNLIKEEVVEKPSEEEIVTVGAVQSQYCIFFFSG